MVSKRKKGKGRRNRQFQEEALTTRINKGQKKTKGFRSKVFREDVDFEMYRPAAGDKTHIVDIIPYYAGKNDPDCEAGKGTYVFEYLMHGGVGPNKLSFICPSMYGQRCPICEYRDKLREKDDPRYKKLWPRQRTLYNVISYDDKSERQKGVQVWDVSYHYFEKHLMAISRKPSRSGKEEKTVNFVSPSNGKSILFKINPAKGKNDYPEYVGHSFDDRDYEIDRKVLKKAFTLDELIKVASYKEIKAAFMGGGSPMGDEDDDEGRDYEELLDKLDDVSDMDELSDFIDDNELDELDFDDEGSFRKQYKSVKKQLKQLMDEDEDETGATYDDDDDDDDDDSDDRGPVTYELVLDQLEEIDDHDDLEDFVDEHDLDFEVDEDKKLRIQKKKLRKLILEKQAAQDDDDDDDDDGEDLRSELEGLSWVKLKKWVKKRDDIDIDLDDYEKADMQELVDDIIDELE